MVKTFYLSSRLHHQRCCHCSYSSVWPDDYITFSKFGHLQQSKLAQLQQKFAKLGAKFCQKLNRPFKIAQVFSKFCQSGKTSPNLVTLLLLLYSISKPFLFYNSSFETWQRKKEFNRLGIPTAGKKYAKGVRNSITQLTLLMMTEWKNLNIQKGSSILKSFLQMFFCQKRI